MKQHLLSVAAALVVLLAATAPSSAQTASFIYNDGNGVANAGTYTPGSSFSFSISLAFTPGGSISNLEGVTYFFEQQSPSAPFNFALTNRDVTGSQFTDVQTALSYPQNLVPSNANDLGALLEGPTGVGQGTYLLANLTFSIAANAAPGVYIIENVTAPGKRAVISDDLGNTFAVSQAIYTITITAVPEPSTWIAGALVLITLLTSQWRRIHRLGRRPVILRKTA